MNKNVFVSFVDDNRKEGVIFPDVEITKNEWGSNTFTCSPIDFINFMSNNGFTAREDVLIEYENKVVKHIYILKGNTVMGNFWFSVEEYKQFLKDTIDLQ